MEKNNFLIYNDIVYNLYRCETFEQLKSEFLPRLKLLVPYTYASVILSDPEKKGAMISTPVCVPDYFIEVEEDYIKHMEEDDLLWINNVKESQLVRESDLVPDERRLSSPIYVQCYQKYHIYDTLQFSIVCNHEFTGVLTLFRTKIDDAFNHDDLFYMRSLGVHINAVYQKILFTQKRKDCLNSQEDVNALAEKHDLTARERQILKFILEFQNNDEIAASLGISENTVQKHLQNIFRKMNVSSKWELLQIRRGKK